MAAEPEPVLTLADFATEADACRSVTAAEWIPNPDALRFHRADAAVHLEATEPGGLMPLCRYTTDGGALLKLQLLELTTARRAVRPLHRGRGVRACPVRPRCRRVVRGRSGRMV